MSSGPTKEPPKTEADRMREAAHRFRHNATSIANTLLKDWVGAERAGEATGRLAVALAASAAAAKDPSDFYACTPASIGKVIAIAALTGIMPSTGGAALAYAIPRRPRRGEAPQLQYQLSHRGINALANRAGMHMVAIPVSHSDRLQVEDSGEVVVVERDIDNPPTTEAELRGVMVLVRRLDTGNLLCRGWVAKKVIDERRAVSDAYIYAEKNAYAQESSPWHVWYVEQAMKTAMHYAIARGWCVVDDTEAVRALQLDAASDYSHLTLDAETIEPTASDDQTKTQLLEEKLAGPNPIETVTVPVSVPKTKEVTK